MIIVKVKNISQPEEMEILHKLESFLNQSGYHPNTCVRITDNEIKDRAPLMSAHEVVADIKSSVSALQTIADELESTIEQIDEDKDTLGQFLLNL